MNSVLVIAEVGVNHNGDLDMANELIRQASIAGADIVKFQTFNSNLLVTENAIKAEYQKKLTDARESQQQMLKKLEFSHQQNLSILNTCHANNLEYLSTAFDLNSIDYLSNLGILRWKIPSGEITNLPYLRRIGAFSMPLILSTGMANLGEIEQAIDILELAGTSRSEITVLHCTTEYPAPPSQVNLHAMNTLREAFRVRVGYSDHTSGIVIPIAAVALGASIIEKHITLDRNLPGPDHAASLEPKEFQNMVRSIRTVEMSLGDGIKRAAPCEASNINIVRKSIVASSHIKVGDVFSETNISVKRPGNGLSPMLWDQVLGLKAKRNFITDEFIEI